jgi:hypothetical protein
MMREVPGRFVLILSPMRFLATELGYSPNRQAADALSRPSSDEEQRSVAGLREFGARREVARSARLASAAAAKGLLKIEKSAAKFHNKVWPPAR